MEWNEPVQGDDFLRGLDNGYFTNPRINIMTDKGAAFVAADSINGTRIYSAISPESLPILKHYIQNQTQLNTEK